MLVLQYQLLDSLLAIFLLDLKTGVAHAAVA
jgi:hypothetical protein